MLYEYEYFDDEEIFGSAPSSVIEAADSAGAAILAAMLAGQRRMLVDVRDAEVRIGKNRNSSKKKAT